MGDPPPGAGAAPPDEVVDLPGAAEPPQTATPEAGPTEAAGLEAAAEPTGTPGPEAQETVEALEPDEGPGWLRWFKDLRPAWKGLAAFVLFLTISIGIYAKPILGEFDTRYVGVGRGDSKLYQWSLAWGPWAVAHGKNPYVTDEVFAPGGADLTWVTTTPGPAMAMWPVTKAFGPLASYNALMVLAPALMAWGAYLVCHRITRRFWASIVGGFLFGFSAYMAGQMHGHLNLVLLFPAPLAVYLVIRRVEGSLGRVAFVALLTLTLLGLFSISTELFATTTVFGVLGFGVALAFGGPARRRIFSAGLLVTLAYGLGALALLPVLIPALEAAPTEAVRPIESASSDLLSFVVPREMFLITGERFRDLTTRFTAAPIEDGSYLTAPLVLMLLLFAATERRSRATWALLTFIAVGAMLTLGPILHVAGAPGMMLPERVLADAPLLKHATPQRFGIYVALAVAVVAAIWLAKGRGWWAWARWGVVLAGVALLLPLVHTPPFHPDRRLEPFFSNGRYRELLRRDEIIFPIPTNKGEEMLWQSSSDFWFRMAQGYLGPTPTPYKGQAVAKGLARNHPHPYMGGPVIFGQWLGEHGVTAIVVSDPAEGSFAELLRLVGFRPADRAGGVSVWRLGPDSILLSHEDVATFSGDLEPGGTLRGFSVTRIDGGERLTRRDYKAQPLVLSFFTMDCQGCASNLAELERFHRGHRDVGALAVAGFDAPVRVRGLAKQLGLTMDIAIDQSQRFSRAFAADSYPVTVVVASDGRILAVRRGPVSAAEIEELVARAAG